MDQISYEVVTAVDNSNCVMTNFVSSLEFEMNVWTKTENETQTKFVAQSLFPRIEPLTFIANYLHWSLKQ